MEKRLDRITPAEYLEQESRSAIRHEYLDGETFPLPAGSQRHKLIVSNVLRRLQAGGLGGGTRVFGSNVRVYVRERNCFYYPDLSASSDWMDREQPYISRPCLIVEVLAPSTAIADRREKRVNYASIPSLKEYVIIDQDRPRVNIFPREDGTCMVRTCNDADDVVEFLGVQISLREIYRGVDFSSDDLQEGADPFRLEVIYKK